MPVPEPVADVLAAERATINDLWSALEATIDGSWTALDRYDTDALAAWEAQMIPVAEAAQFHAAAVTAAYLAAVETAATGEPVLAEPVEVADVSTEALRGAPAVDVWHRPAKTIWAALADDVAVGTAIVLGLRRALEIGETDLQLARTSTARRVMSVRSTIVGYRRAPSGRACDVCIAASRRRHRKTEPMPIHARCRCSVLPIFRDVGDPGDLVDPEALAAAGVQPIAVHHHGETGPTLTPAGRHFTGPREVAT